MTADAPGPSPRGSKGGPVAQPLTLITLAGEELPIAVDPNAHACLQGYLVMVSSLTWVTTFLG